MIRELIRLVWELVAWLRSFNTRKKIIEEAAKDEDQRVADAKDARNHALAEFDERERLSKLDQSDPG